MDGGFIKARNQAFKRAEAMISVAKELTRLYELHGVSHAESLRMRSDTLREGLSYNRDFVEKIKRQHPRQHDLALFTNRIEKKHKEVASALELLPKKRNDEPIRRKVPVDIKREVKHGKGGSKTTVSNDDGTVAESPEVLKEAGVISKHDWMEEGRNTWDLEDDAIRSKVQSEKVRLLLHTYGSIGEGCGAILRDSRKNPIVASCQPLSHDDSVSEFYTHLKGVALAAKIAAEYCLSQFFLYVPTDRMNTFISSIWDPYNRSPQESLEKSLVKSLCFPKDGDIEKIYSLTLVIMSYLNKLSASGVVKYFAVQPALSTRNKAAEFLCKLSVDKEYMKSEEICRDERLSDILYEDVVGKFYYL